MSPVCPACGQVLVVGALDLRAAVQCPRCGTVHHVAHLVPTTTPLPAMPVTPGQAPAAQLPVIVPGAPAMRVEPAAGMRPSNEPTPPPPGSVDMGDTAPRVGLAHAVLDVADRIDAAFYGRRLALLVVLSAIVAALSWWETASTPRDLRWTAIGTCVLAAYLEVLLLARVGSLRDDAKRWSAQLLRERLGAWWEDVVASMGAARTLPGALWLRSAGTFLTSFAVVLLGLRNLLVLAQVALGELLDVNSSTLVSIDSSIFLAGCIGVGLGVTCWVLGLWLARRSVLAARLTVHDNERTALAHAAQAMPLGILDCGDPTALSALARGTPHPLFAALLSSLAAWKPRNHGTEAAYVASLVRKLRERMPGADAERERPMRDGAQRYRADLVVGDAVLLEMKRGISASSAQRAVGQALTYARLWANKGPVLLLICGAPRPAVEGYLGPHLATLRGAGVIVATAR